jgi:hypothetical protein
MKKTRQLLYVLLVPAVLIAGPIIYFAASDYLVKTRYMIPVVQKTEEFRERTKRLPNIEEFRTLASECRPYKGGRYILFSKVRPPLLPLRNPESDFVICAAWGVGEDLYYQPWDHRLYSYATLD